MDSETEVYSNYENEEILGEDIEDLGGLREDIN